LLCSWLCAALASAAAGEASDKGEDRAGRETESASPYMRAVRDKEKAAASSERLVFSNDDLEQRYGPPPDPEPEPDESTGEAGEPVEQDAPAAGEEAAAHEPTEGKAGETEGEGEAAQAAPPDALQQIAEEQAQASERREQISEAESKVQQARQRVQALERRVLALRNPLLARPAAPEEEREAWDRADTRERVARSEGEIERARAELADAEQELTRLKGTP
jgi:hypothetical protein